MAFASIGISLFGSAGMTEVLGPHGNFATFPSALLLLLRCSGGERWDETMFAIWNSGKPFASLAPVFFISFIALVVFILTNIFVLLIVDEFDKDRRQRKGMVQGDLRHFREQWALIDPYGTGWIPIRQLEPFLRSVNAPLGLPPSATFTEYLLLLRRLDLVAWDGCVAFENVLLACHRETLGIGIPRNIIRRMPSRPDRMRIML